MAFISVPEREVLEVIELDDEDPSGYIAGLLKDTKTKIQFSTALSDFYKYADIQNSFIAIAKKGIPVDLLLDVDVDWETKRKELETIFNAFTGDKLTVKQSKEKIPHWLIIDDGNHIRIEKEHKNGKDVIRTSNAILYHTKNEKDEAVIFLVKNINDNFNDWWKDAEPMTVTK